MSLLVFYVLLALGVSFLCSVLEAVLLSITPSFVAHLEQAAHRRAETLKHLKTEIDQPLAAILSLNTIAHTIGAAGAGAQAQALWGSEVLAVASIVLTLLILVLSEIVPKTLGARYWRRLAPWAVWLLPWMIRGLYPMVWLANRISRGLGRAGGPSTAVRREEFTALAQAGARDRILEEQESRILRNLFRFNELRVEDVMTPGTVVCSLEADTTIEDATADESIQRVSRIPVWRDHEDNVLGYVLKDDLLLAAARGNTETKVADMVRPSLFVSEKFRLARLLELLLERREHIAVATDEFGTMVGVVTLEDVVETLLGMEIVDESDAAADMRALARRQWRERAQRMGLVTDGSANSG